MSSSKRVAYMSSKDYNILCDKHPKVKERASITDSLIEAFGLKPSLLNVNPEPASKEDLLKFHTEDYVACLEKIEKIMEENYPPMKGEDSMFEVDIDYEHDDEFSDVINYGFGYDCGVFSELYSYCKSVVGATIGAAKILNQNNADVAINLNGGWHHGHVDEAAGFCYINDVVIGILTLMERFKRILYIDLDVHHGDGVEEAFKYSKKVMTLSLHNYEDGFFPGTGGGADIHDACAKNLAVNVPLKNGITDEMFVGIFKEIFADVVFKFQPEVIVCQCGADGMTGDPMGAFNLTSKALSLCMDEISNTRLPLMVLGGGGYHVANTARSWVQVVARILGQHLDDDIPEHDYLEEYGPDFSLIVTPSNRRNENKEKYITDLIKLVKENISNLCESKADGMVVAKSVKEVGACKSTLKDSTNMIECADKPSDCDRPMSVSCVETKHADILSTNSTEKRSLDENGMHLPSKKICLEGIQV